MTKPTTLALMSAIVLVGAAAAGCSGGDSPAPEDPSAATSSDLRGEPGKKLFFDETFGGNGRTCGTCHSAETGTLSPAQIRLLSRFDPRNPIFRSIDSDDGVGNSYTRLKKNATIRITLDLPPNIRLHDNPSAKTFTVNRGIPTPVNTSLFPQLMWDGREPTLESQALDAVHDHFQNRFEPSTNQIRKIADYERTLFTNSSLARFAAGGPPPRLPDGNTASEKRGRAFFNSDGLCGSCHSGPLLNETTDTNLIGVPPGTIFASTFVGFEDVLGFPEGPDAVNPVVTFDMDCTEAGILCANCEGLGGTLENNVCVGVGMPDPLEAIPTANPDNFLLLKIGSLWGIKDTAPYFHDNSAATLEDVMAHYDRFFTAFTGTGLSAQDQKDLIAFLRLL